MILDSASASHLKPWLVRTLEPICDAEPGALADYILALLKHTVPESEMRKELAVQLDEFLEKAECSSFIDTLFTVLRTKSYLPYSTTPSSPSFTSKTLDTGIPIPLDGLLSPSEPTSPQRGHKRSIENDERDGRPPAKGPRLNTDGQFSRYGNGHGNRQDGRAISGWTERSGGARQQGNGFADGAFDGFGGGMANMGMNMMGAMGLGLGGMSGMNGVMGQMNSRRQQAYQPPGQKRGICRDYHNNGYCARGAMCKYSHGDDAVIPGQLYSMPSMPGLPFMPMFPGGVPFIGGSTGAAYDPHESRMDMRPMPGRPQNRAPVLPRIQQEDGSRVLHSVHASGELPVIQDLTPTLPPDPPAPSTEPSASDVQSTPTDQFPQPIPVEHGGIERNEYSQRGEAQPFMNVSTDVEMASPMDMAPPSRHQNGAFRGGSRGVARGRGGIFGGEVHNFRPERRKDKTLVVEKIPEDKLSREHLNAWFKKFGTVTHVAVDNSNAKALVSFSTHDEAHAAWKSEDAVFNNRFVKIFWHRPMEGHGQVGARMLAASAPLVANYAAHGSPNRLSTSLPSASANAASSSRKTTTSAATALAAKQQLLEQQIAEQKSLMASLSTASPDEKKEIMTRLRKLGDEIKSTTVTPASSRPAVTPKKAPSMSNLSDHEQKERERLDKELELHHVTASVGADEENAEDLKAKLDRLKAEAASLGISEAASESSHPSGGGTYRPYRGRARGGRSLYRGAMRGGPPRASMKLDNRPKKLLVKAIHRDSLQALRDWYETTNQVDSFEALDDGDVIVSFKSRAAAEQGLAKGTTVPTVGPLQISWFTGKQPNAASTPRTPLAIADSVGTSGTPPAANRLRSPEPPLLHSPHMQEEEIVASGWGGDGEDGMGML
ncbi:hypothetical protein BD779DRAFT_1483445 [Infundibulicybe gibba]|nr:hypothetical protein BD779DRAFT_1483445 [Infundibulicybe gibba]